MSKLRVDISDALRKYRLVIGQTGAIPMDLVNDLTAITVAHADMHAEVAAENAGRPEPLRLELNLADAVDRPAFADWLRKEIRTHAGGPGGTRTAVADDKPCWVLVKGCSGSDAIDAVHGPYTEARARWLIDNLLSSSYAYWTMHKLSSGPEGI